jgi:hypothetical protein
MKTLIHSLEGMQGMKETQDMLEVATNLYRDLFKIKIDIAVLQL